MSRDPVEKRIEEHVYRVRPMPPRRILQTAPVLAKLVLPAMGRLVDGATASGKGLQDVLNQDVSGMSFGAAAEALMGAWDQPQIDKLIDELAASTEVCLDGDKWPQLSRIFDAHFSGRTKEMLGWLVFAVQEQYQDFFGGLLGAAQDRAAASRSPSISAGQPGESSSPASGR
jgi:hypothetical protein